MVAVPARVGSSGSTETYVAQCRTARVGSTVKTATTRGAPSIKGATAVVGNPFDVAAAVANIIVDQAR